MVVSDTGCVLCCWVLLPVSGRLGVGCVVNGPCRPVRDGRRRRLVPGPWGVADAIDPDDADGVPGEGCPALRSAMIGASLWRTPMSLGRLTGKLLWRARLTTRG